MIKPIEELTIMNDFLFSVVMRQEKYCRPLLEYILKIKIKRIEYIGEEESIRSALPSAKSIRLDVFVEDDQGSVYDIEVQTTDQHNLGKRSRYYQSMMDIRVLEKGADYRELKKSFVIFICNFDPFRSSRYIYTFRNRCDEEPEETLNDEAVKIIINTKGTRGEISDELKAVIRYMDSGMITSDYTEALDAEVKSVKFDEKVRMSYMLMQEALMRERRAGGYQVFVRQIRRKHQQLNIADMAEMFDVSPDNCESVVETINEHPDWDDEQVAEVIWWDK